MCVCVLVTHKVPLEPPPSLFSPVPVDDAQVRPLLRLRDLIVNVPNNLCEEEIVVLVVVVVTLVSKLQLRVRGGKGRKGLEGGEG